MKLNCLDLYKVIINLKFDIHGFADASLLAYGCCIYIRTFDTEFSHPHLLIRKSRVTTVLNKILNKIKKNLNPTVIVYSFVLN